MMKLNSSSNLDFKEMDSKNQNTLIDDEMDMDMKLEFSESEDEETEPVKNDLNGIVKSITTNGIINADSEKTAATNGTEETNKLTELKNKILDQIKLNELSENDLLNDKDDVSSFDDKIDETNDMLDDVTSLDDINSPEAVLNNASLDDISSSETNNSENKDDESPDDLNTTLEFPEDDSDTVEIKKEIIDNATETNILITSASTIIKDEIQDEKQEIVGEILNETVDISNDLKMEEELNINDTIDNENINETIDNEDSLLERLDAADTDLLKEVDDETSNDIKINHTVEKADIAMDEDDDDDIDTEMTSFIRTTVDNALLSAKDPLEQTIEAKNIDNYDTEDEPPIKKKCDEDIRRSVDDMLNNDSSSSLLESTDCLSSVDSILKSIEEDDSMDSLSNEIKNAIEENEESVTETLIEEVSLKEKSVQDESVTEAKKDDEEVEQVMNEDSIRKSVDEAIKDDSLRKSVDEAMKDDFVQKSVDEAIKEDSIRSSVDEAIKDDSVQKSIDKAIKDDSVQKSIDKAIKDDSVRKSVDEAIKDDSIRTSVDEAIKDDAIRTSVDETIKDDSVRKSVDEAIKDDFIENKIINESNSMKADEEPSDKIEPPPLDDDDDVCIVERDPFDDIPSDSSNTEDKAKSNKRSSQVLDESVSDSNIETSKKVKLTDDEDVLPAVIEDSETDITEKLIIDEKSDEPEPEPQIEKETETDDNVIKTIEIIPTCIPDIQSESDDAAKQENNLLEPMPKTVVKQSIELMFLKKFKKEFLQMTRNDLEELILQKVVEAIVNKSELSEMRHKIENQELRIQTFQTKTAELAKQYRDLEMVHKKVLSDLEVRNSGVIMPVKITRAVGLQVCSPRHPTPLPSSTPPPPINANKTIKVTAGVQTPNTPPHLTKQLVNVTPPNRQIRTVHKITPMRPPLSDQQTQHVKDQQQFQKNQLMQRQQTMARNKLAQQKIQLQQAQQAQQQQAAKTAAAISAKMLQTQQIVQQQQQQRVPPVIVKKTANQRFITVQTGSTPTSPMVNIPPKPSTAPKSVIDLTDEEDNQKTKPNILNGQLPPLAAFPGGNKKPGYSLGQQPRSPNIQAQQRMTLSKVNQTAVAIVPRVSSMPPRRTNTAMSRRPNGHPAPLPFSQNPSNSPTWKRIPPRPIIRINNVETGIVISWSVDDLSDEHAEIVTYQIYAYQETSSPPSTDTWRHVGDVKSMLLPMAVTLTQFQEGQRYHFAVRAVDEHSRCGMFSPARTWV